MAALLFFTQLTHIVTSQSVNYYIKDWILDTNKEGYKEAYQYAGYDVNTQLIYVIGGNVNTQFNYSPETIYDPNNGSCAINTTYWPVLYEHALVSGVGQTYTTIFAPNSSSYLYFGQSYDGSFYQLDMQNNVLKNLHGKITSTNDECYTNDGNQYIYMIGGMHYENLPKNPPSKIFKKFDIVNHKWIVGPSLNYNRSNSGCTYINGTLFVFGGDRFNQTTIETVDVTNSNDSNNSYWSVVVYTGNMGGNIEPFAVYPVKNAKTNDNWRGNTIFLFHSYYYWGQYQECFNFNFRTAHSTSCTLSYPPINIEGWARVYGYIGNEYRLYLFGGSNASSTYTSNAIQHAIFDTRCLWNVNELTLDLTVFNNVTMSAASQTNNRLLYRYSPCANMLSCNGVKDMVDLVDIATLDCEKYLAVWNHTGQYPNYDSVDKSWQFLYTNGENCNGFESVLTVIWECDATVSTYVVKTAKNIAQCQDEIIIASKHACTK
eukprot:553920_1